MITIITYKKAVKSLGDAGFDKPARVDTAITASKQPNVEFTYPEWAEAGDDPEAFDEGLENAGIL